MGEPQTHAPERASRPRLVILGSGFAAFSLLKAVDDDLYDLLVISPRNHFIFTPLLPSTTVGTIEFRSIIEPIRSAKRRLEFFQAECTGVDAAARLVRCAEAAGGREFTVSYDILVVAVGGVSNTYGIPGVAEHALFLKDLGDARAIRQRIIDCFERASTPGVPPEERRRLLHCVVVGGGPTGVEFAAEMHDFLVQDLAAAFPRLRSEVRITLLEAAGGLLGSFDSALGAYTAKHFARQKIDVKTNHSVAAVDGREVTLKDGSRIPYGLLVWSTGVGATPLVKSLPFRKDSASRILIDDYCRVEDAVYALGDCAAHAARALPATSQVAQQQGRYLASSLARVARGRAAKPFRYRHFGMLAYIGGEKALADLSAVKGRGFITWLFWRSAYLTKLVSLKNKLLVLFDWLKTAMFGRDVSRF